jgi:hypothetical protein
MKLIWKLLRQHISVAQLTGFFTANLFGLVIVLLSVQLYHDILPLFTGEDSLMKNDYIIISKRVNPLGGLLNRSSGFSEAEVEELRAQSFATSVGEFTPSNFKVSTGISMAEAGVNMGTAMFFESVPDQYVDVDLQKWSFDEASDVVPIIIPRNYLNLYNFGFAKSRGLPQLSEGLMSLIQMDIYMSGDNGEKLHYKGNIVGFSNRLNTILVPQKFIDWANDRLAPGKKNAPSRLIVEVENSADSSLAKYLQQRGYETENDKLDNSRMTYLLRVVTAVVAGVGGVISVLSFYILMLSVFLLLQKNTVKLQNLMLIGYSPRQVALPYQMLTVGLNVVNGVVAVIIVAVVRSLYIDSLTIVAPQMSVNPLAGIFVICALLVLAVSLINIVVIYRKIVSIWMRK